MRCNAFEKTDGAPERHGVGSRSLQTFAPDHRRFLYVMQRAATHNYADLRIQPMKWPTSPMGGLNCDEFHFLDDPSYRADFHVCFVSSLYDVGPEIAHLILDRRQSAHMVLVVSDQPVTSEYAMEIRNGISAISESTYQRAEGNILMPTMYSGETNDAEAAGKLAFFSMRDRADALERLKDIFL